MIIKPESENFSINPVNFYMAYSYNPQDETGFIFACHDSFIPLIMMAKGLQIQLVNDKKGEMSFGKNIIFHTKLDPAEANKLDENSDRNTETLTEEQVLQKRRFLLEEMDKCVTLNMTTFIQKASAQLKTEFPHNKVKNLVVVMDPNLGYPGASIFPSIFIDKDENNGKFLLENILKKNFPECGEDGKILRFSITSNPNIRATVATEVGEMEQLQNLYRLDFTLLKGHPSFNDEQAITIYQRIIKRANSGQSHSNADTLEVRLNFSSNNSGGDTITELSNFMPNAFPSLEQCVETEMPSKVPTSDLLKKSQKTSSMASLLRLFSSCFRRGAHKSEGSIACAPSNSKTIDDARSLATSSITQSSGFNSEVSLNSLNNPLRATGKFFPKAPSIVNNKVSPTMGVSTI